MVKKFNSADPQRSIVNIEMLVSSFIINLFPLYTIYKEDFFTPLTKHKADAHILNHAHAFKKNIVKYLSRMYEQTATKARYQNRRKPMGIRVTEFLTKRFFIPHT